MSEEQRHSVTKQLPIHGRRTLRFPCTLQVSCQVLIDETAWSATVRNISKVGVGLIAGCLFSPGTVLRIHLQAAGQNHVIESNVVYSRSERADSWFHGCQFKAALTNSELAALLASC